MTEYKDIPKHFKMFGKALTVGDLKKKLENIRDETPVFIPGEDHSFVPVSQAYGLTAAYNHHSKDVSEFNYLHGLGKNEEMVFVFIVTPG